jgi:hypothetical protein
VTEATTDYMQAKYFARSGSVPAAFAPGTPMHLSYCKTKSTGGEGLDAAQLWYPKAAKVGRDPNMSRVYSYSGHPKCCKN